MVVAVAVVLVGVRAKVGVVEELVGPVAVVVTVGGSVVGRRVRSVLGGGDSDVGQNTAVVERWSAKVG